MRQFDNTFIFCELVLTACATSVFKPGIYLKYSQVTISLQTRHLFKLFSGDTVVTRYLSSSTSDVHTITTADYPPLLIDVASDAPCELVSDQPVMVTQVVNAPVTTGKSY